MNFGANLAMAHGDSARGRDALAALGFVVHADLILNPIAEQADIVLPVASAFETEGLKVGLEISETAQSLVQLRRPLVSPRGEARSDLQIIFALTTRLGLGAHFWHGDLDAAWRHQLAPSGVTLEQLRGEPAGVRVPLQTRHRKHAERDDQETPRGFGTPSRKVELYSELLAEAGYPPLPEFEEPRSSPRSRPDLAERFPLILSCAKSLWFCETQHRNLRRAWPRRLPAVRPGQRQPQPGAAPTSQRPDQRQLAPARLNLRHRPPGAVDAAGVVSNRVTAPREAADCAAGLQHSRQQAYHTAAAIKLPFRLSTRPPGWRRWPGSRPWAGRRRGSATPSGPTRALRRGRPGAAPAGAPSAVAATSAASTAGPTCGSERRTVMGRTRSSQVMAAAGCEAGGDRDARCRADQDAGTAPVAVKARGRLRWPPRPGRAGRSAASRG